MLLDLGTELSMSADWSFLPMWLSSFSFSSEEEICPVQRTTETSLRQSAGKHWPRLYRNHGGVDEVVQMFYSSGWSKEILSVSVDQRQQWMRLNGFELMLLCSFSVHGFQDPNWHEKCVLHYMMVLSNSARSLQKLPDRQFAFLSACEAASDKRSPWRGYASGRRSSICRFSECHCTNVENRDEIPNGGYRTYQYVFRNGPQGLDPSEQPRLNLLYCVSEKIPY